MDEGPFACIRDLQGEHAHAKRGSVAVVTTSPGVTLRITGSMSLFKFGSKAKYAKRSCAGESLDGESSLRNNTPGYNGHRSFRFSIRSSRAKHTSSPR